MERLDRDLVTLLNELDLHVAVTASPPADADGRSLLEKIATITPSVPAEEWENFPTDLAANHDPYLYGAPKHEPMRAVFADTAYWVAVINPRDSWHCSH